MRVAMISAVLFGTNGIHKLSSSVTASLPLLFPLPAFAAEKQVLNTTCTLDCYHHRLGHQSWQQQAKASGRQGHVVRGRLRVVFTT